jgi:hypothetical protein
MYSKILITDINRVLASDMSAGKKVRAIRMLINRWTALEFKVGMGE